MTGGLAEKIGDLGAAATIAEPALDLLPGALNRPAPVTLLQPRRPAFHHLHNASGRAKTALSESVRHEAEFGHLFYWSPVLAGLGAAYWFWLDHTPAVAPCLFVCIAAAVVWLVLGPWRPVGRAIALSVALVAGGALLAAFETMRQETIVLDGPVTVTIRGFVTAREIDSRGRWRYDIRLMETERPVLKRAPAMIRATALERASAGFSIGQAIEGRARLSPPSGPALPGLNDFAFASYFDGFGAAGFFYGQPKLWEGAPAPADPILSQWLQWLEALRGQISARIRSILPGDTGGFAASMVTDDRRAMSPETTEALRLAGLTHIIAISGLNMALAAGISFVGLRLLFSLSQEFSHRLPVKRIAAAGALITVTLYYLISGFAVSAERAYVMMAIMLVAAFFGRPSISLRNVALSALAIIIVSPSALTGPGFQMSYAATLALVAGYSALQRRTRFMAPIANGLPVLGRVMPAWKFMGGIFMTSLIGGLSTALFSVEYFNRVATWGLPANLLAMPVISFVVMPAGLVALILMPFGLDWLPITIMGYGLDFVIAVAKWVSAQGGEWVTGQIPEWLFVGMSLGLLMLAIMRSRLRFLGAGLAAGLLCVHLALPAERVPSLIVFEDGSLAGLIDGRRVAISQSRPSDFILEQWQRALRLTAVVRPEPMQTAKEPSGTKDDKGRRRLTSEEIDQARREMAGALARNVGRFACRERHWCITRAENGLVVIVALNGGYAGLACELADIVVTPARLKWQSCRSGATLYTGETLRRTGSLEIFVSESDYAPPELRVIGALDGKVRPWTMHRRYDWHTDKFAED